MRPLVVLDEEEVQSQARVPAAQRLGPQVPEAGEFQDLRQQIQEMQRKINRGRVFTTRTNTLLAPEIFAEPYPQGFKVPFVKRYDGESDPQEHINSYVQVMIAVDTSDALMCRCFLQTVDSKVADWVNHILAGSIRTWDELGLRFLEHFAGNCRPKKHFTHLASVRQKHGESLKNFLVRWRTESMEVEGIDDKSRLAMFTAELQDGLLHTDLTTHPPDTFEESMVRAGRYVTLEEKKEEKKEKTPKEEEKAGNKKPFKNKKQGFPDGPKGTNPGTSEKHKSANPVFTLPVAVVMAHTAQQGLMTYPTYSQKVCNVEETGKWCAYHRKNDHNTKDSYTLKNEMARMGSVEKGRWPQEKRHIGLEDEEEDSEPAPHRQKRHHGCNYIIGGNIGGDSATTRKMWASAAMVNKVAAPAQPEGKKLKTEPIVFSNADLPEMGVPHRDALVITIDIMDLLIHKTLVDTGSSVNVMYMDTYKALGLMRHELLPIKTPLTGFTGHSIEPEGVITLPVEVGDTKATRKLDMEFVVVGIVSNTNVILGRPRLEDLECVISPRYLCIKFPTPRGIGVARGSQRVSRAWYLKATKQPIKYDTQDAKPVKQKRRHLSQERRDFVKKEVTTLQSIGHIRETALSVTVIVRDENGAQHPVYYVSKTLRDAELRYSHPEKAMLAVFWTAKRLTPYFQAHRIVVLTNEPLASLTRSPAESARMTKWAVFISQYNVEFRPRPSIKGQTLADFQVECTAREMTRARVDTRVEDDWWVMSIDRSSGSRSCGAGIVLITPENFRIYYAIRFQFRVSNNEAEYEALINGLKILGKLGASRVQVYSDSRLVVGQISGEFEAKEERMKRYRDLSLEVLGKFEYKLEHIPRAYNAEADVLSKLSAESPEYISKLATVEVLATPSLNICEVLWVSADPPKWLDRLARYIEDGVAPEDPQEARLLRMRAPTYKVMEGILYKRWGIDIVGALPKGIGQARWIVVAIDYFTKWVEAEPLAGITGKQMIDFVGTNILCRFGVPKQIISDNGTQFEEAEFQDFLKTWGIQHTKVSVAYPQANGQVENVNRTIISGIKKKLLSERSKWVDELPRVLWTYRTTPRRATGDTPFGLAYGFEARAPAETVIPTRREMTYDREVNEQNQAVELNFLNERRDKARIRAEKYRRQVKSYFESRVKPRAFQVGDYVLRKREKSQQTKGGKLAKKFTGR
ncbi:unnamed protein product [Cuscuta campestris]|uniref:Uncharacterized protein n=1 Tax=Cuscuta campestris TaxID=132261 RepID=A0A484MP37_9ASTE|nr:unnamed protein product [Cuscuta campestris]